MSKDVKCPYCGEWQEINHDDGYGEGETFEQECADCEKNFVYTTAIIFYYDAKKADCLNGADHNYEPTRTYPKKYTEMKCVDCGYRRSCSDEEMEKVLSS